MGPGPTVGALPDHPNPLGSQVGPQKWGGPLRVQVPNSVRPESSPFQPDIQPGQRPPGWMTGYGSEGTEDVAGRGWARRCGAVAGERSLPLLGEWSLPLLAQASGRGWAHVQSAYTR